MHAQVAPREELAAGTPDDNVFAKYPSRDWATVNKLCDKRYRVPILYEYGVIDHRQSSTDRACCDDATPMGPRAPTIVCDRSPAFSNRSREQAGARAINRRGMPLNAPLRFRYFALWLWEVARRV